MTVGEVRVEVRIRSSYKFTVFLENIDLASTCILRVMKDQFSAGVVHDPVSHFSEAQTQLDVR